MRQQKFDEAGTYFAKSQHILAHILNAPTEDKVYFLESWAIAYEEQGELEKSLESYKQAVREGERAWSLNDDRVVDDLAWVAVRMRRQCSLLCKGYTVLRMWCLI